VKEGREEELREREKGRQSTVYFHLVEEGRKGGPGGRSLARSAASMRKKGETGIKKKRERLPHSPLG